MTRLLTLALALACAACAPDAPPPTRAEAQPYSIVSERPDPAGGLTVAIKVSGAATEETIKSTAESIITARRDKYQNVTVNTFVDGERPVAVSKLEGGRVSHAFAGDARGKQVRIPTH